MISHFPAALCLAGLSLLTANLQAQKPELTNGTLTLRAGDYEATFTEEAFWTLDTLNFKDVALITPTGANQTVIKMLPSPGVAEKDEWVGTKHGHEVIESVEIAIDGQPHDLTKTQGLPEGSTYVITKVSRFGPYKAKWVVTLDKNGLKEDAKFEEVESSAGKVAYAYVFMHCWSPRMQDWMAVLKDGTDVGERFPDEPSKSLQEDISSFAIYSEQEKTGALLIYPEAYSGFKDRKSFLNNFPNRHNKLYLTVSNSALSRNTYTCTVQGFTAGPHDWKEVVLDLRKKAGTSQ